MATNWTPKVGDRVRVVGDSEWCQKFDQHEPAVITFDTGDYCDEVEDGGRYNVEQGHQLWVLRGIDIEPWPDTPTGSTRPAFTREELARDILLAILRNERRTGPLGAFARDAFAFADAFLSELNKEPADAE